VQSISRNAISRPECRETCIHIMLYPPGAEGREGGRAGEAYFHMRARHAIRALEGSSRRSLLCLFSLSQWKVSPMIIPLETAEPNDGTEAEGGGRDSPSFHTGFRVRGVGSFTCT